jgi:hypothetical protein
MVLAIYDVARQGSRKRVERILREAGFVFVFRNARWTGRVVGKGAVARRLAAALRGEAHRILLLDVPSGNAARARWLHGSQRKDST